MMSSVLRGLRKITLNRAPVKPRATTAAAGATRPATRVAPAADAGLAGVTMEYRPDLDGEPDPGEVVWTWVPWEEDPTQGKDRPVVLIGRRGSMLVGVPLTSKRHDNEPQVAIGTGPWDHEGRPSYVKLDRILDVDPAQVRREGAVLPRERYDEIIAALRR
jgi:hypothetical protein